MRKQVSTLVIATIVAAAALVPSAGAVPIYDGNHVSGTGQAYDVNRETGEYVPATASRDMHASSVVPTGADLRTEAAKSPIVADVKAGTAVVAGSDLRTEAAKSPIVADLKVDGAVPAGSDLRSEAAKGPGTAPLPGPPTWPTDPKPIVPATPDPVAATDPGDGSFDWPLAGLLAGGAIALAGAALVTRQQMRGHARPAR